MMSFVQRFLCLVVVFATSSVALGFNLLPKGRSSSFGRLPSRARRTLNLFSSGAFDGLGGYFRRRHCRQYFATLGIAVTCAFGWCLASLVASLRPQRALGKTSLRLKVPAGKYSTNASAEICTACERGKRSAASALPRVRAWTTIPSPSRWRGSEVRSTWRHAPPAQRPPSRRGAQYTSSPNPGPWTRWNIEW